jgi:hypothetical protein
LWAEEEGGIKSSVMGNLKWRETKIYLMFLDSLPYSDLKGNFHLT